jgi:hypothetical protein
MSRNMMKGRTYLIVSLGLTISIVSFVSGVLLSDFIRSVIPRKDLADCGMSLFADRPVMSHARVINQSSKEIRFTWIGSNQIQEAPFNLPPGQIGDIHGVINNAVCISNRSRGADGFVMRSMIETLYTFSQ